MSSCLVTVVAGIEDDTQVNITHGGTTLVDSVTVNRGEVLQYLSSTTPTDINGAFISATNTGEISTLTKWLNNTNVLETCLLFFNHM